MSVEAHRTITVQIVDDATAVKDFLAWQMDECVFPIRGTVTAGLGGYFGTFHGDDERDVMRFLALRPSASDAGDT